MFIAAAAAAAAAAHLLYLYQGPNTAVMGVSISRANQVSPNHSMLSTHAAACSNSSPNLLLPACHLRFNQPVIPLLLLLPPVGRM
jgi:hypothetical protein